MQLIKDQAFDEERALYGSRDIEAVRLKFDGPADGESAFKESRNITVKDCFFNLRYPFWHAKNVVIKDSIVKGEYLAWYCENVTFINCTITGTQPLCYCKGLKLINCRMIDCDLSFEKSDVDADIVSSVTSIKNPKSGNIRAIAVGDLIMDDPDARAVVTVAPR